MLFTYKTILTKAVGSYMASTLFSIVAGAEDFFNGTPTEFRGMTAPDDNTVVFTLSAPNAPFAFSILTQHSIIPEHVWKDVPAEEMTKPATWETGQIGTGPFKFVEYQPDQFLKLDRMPMPGAAPRCLMAFSSCMVGTTPEAQAAALEKGDLDYAGVPAAEYDRLRARHL